MSVGVDLRPVKFILIAVSSLLTGNGGFASAGVIGFVDLIAPHVVRRFFGSSHRLLVPRCPRCSAACSWCWPTWRPGRVLAPRELPVGAVTALIGAPFFA